MNLSTQFSLLLLKLVTLLTQGLPVWTDDRIPHFTQEPSSIVTSLDSSLTLPCRVLPPSAVVRWKFNEHLIDSGSGNSFGFTFRGTDLHIEKFSDGRPSSGGNEGVYQCLAETPYGTIFSKPARISKAVLKKFEDRDNLHLNVTEGGNLVLPCQPPYSIPKAEIMYKFNNSKIISGVSDHYRILSSGNLLVINVTTSDQGRYECMAYNPIRNRTRVASHFIQLQVVSARAPRQEPAIIMPTTKLLAVVGDNVTLECSAVGNPQPNITWEKYGENLRSGAYTVEYGNLYLNDVTTRDGGTYVCNADNGLKPLIRKALMLDVSEPPAVHSVQQTVNASVGDDVELECVVSGKPQPQITWFHNGQYVISSKTGGQKLSLSNVARSQRGLFQCLAENGVGIDYAIIYLNLEDSEDAKLGDGTIPDPSRNDKNSHDQKKSTAKEKKRRRKEKKDKKGKKQRQRQGNVPKRPSRLSLVPPDRPEVKQLSDTSVMLNWTVPEDTGLSITFFRVQYKEVGTSKGNWKTEDDEIKGHIRMYEVRNLKAGGTYKFRIAAVYSNNDNKHGPNSDRFELQIDPEPEPKPPSTAPIIVEATPIDYQSIHALNIKWQHNSISTSPIEGFFIFYKPFASEARFQNVTLLASGVRAHLLTKLLPSTEYLIKMQSFNTAGKSPYSNQVVKRTNGPDGSQDWDRPPVLLPEPDNNGGHINGGHNNGGHKLDPFSAQPTPAPTTAHPKDENRPSKTSADTRTNEMIYMVVGIVLGAMMLLLIVFMFMCWWKQRQQRRMMDAVNDAVRNKFQDSSQRIYTDSMRKKFMNGGFVLNGVNGSVANGHIPRNYHKMNINVNPLSEVDSMTSPDGSSNFMPSTFHPNGTLPGQHRASDNNCNNINRSKSLENSIQNSHCQHGSPGIHDSQTLEEGGEVPTETPPVPIPNGVPVGCVNSDCHEQCTNLNQSCDRLAGSHDQSVRSCDSSLSYDDTGGIQNGRHRKRRRRGQAREQSTKDQATNTDLSSNEGTLDMPHSKVNSSSLESGQLSGTNPRTNLHNENAQFMQFSPTAAGV